MSQVQGMTSEKFAGLVDYFQASLDSGADVGASIAVYQHEQLVADLWGGYRDEAKTIPWDRDTLVNVWSSTKTMTFLVALMLHDRGELDFNAPVAKYWPEFAANGKAEIEVRHIMNHCAGLSGWQVPMAVKDLADWDRATSLLAAQEPWWQDRTLTGYHAATQGFLIGEVVRRITGTTIGQFFKSEVADVLGVDFYIGLPESEEHRVSVVIPPPPEDFSNDAPDSIRVRSLWQIDEYAVAPQTRLWRSAEIPAANGHGNALSVATVQQVMANNGQVNGHRFFSEKTGDMVFERQVGGIDQVLGVDMSFGLGYGLASSYTPVGPRTCFWGGFGGSLIMMDQELGLTVSYMMNKMAFGLIGDTRGGEISLLAAVAAMS
jgi:CubicO group peptidase (beta-lactamase class C family)